MEIGESLRGEDYSNFPRLRPKPRLPRRPARMDMRNSRSSNRIIGTKSPSQAGMRTGSCV
jgi:hypothetical protein